MDINKLKVLRKNKNISQSFLGNALKITQSAYNKKENGLNPFTLKEVKQLKKILNISDYDIIDIFFR